MKPPKKVVKHGRERWQVDLREFGGGRLYFETEVAAKRFQTSALDEQLRYGKLAFDLPVETRRRYLALDEQASEAGTTLEEALAWWKKTHVATEQKKLSEAVEACLLAKTSAGRRKRYVWQLQACLTSFAESVGDLLCSQVAASHIEAWKVGKAWNLRTWRGHLLKLSALFEFARKRRWCASNPVEQIEEPTEEPLRPGLLAPDEVQRLFKVCGKTDPGLIPFLTLATFCGLRLTEAGETGWDRVDLKRGYVEVEPMRSKTRERRLVAIQPNAAAWLRLKGQLPAVNWSDRIIALRKAARIGTNYKKAWPHNCLRHSFCSYSLPVFGAAKTSEWAGHSEAMLFKHYRELVTRQDAEKFWAVVP